MSAKPWETVDGVPTYKLFIDGEWVQSSCNTIVDDFNPSTGTLYARIEQAGAEEVERALASAYRAKDTWVHINDCTVADEPHVPFGGVKNSGVGREGGAYSMEEMTELKWITIQMGQRQFPF